MQSTKSSNCNDLSRSLQHLQITSRNEPENSKENVPPSSADAEIDTNSVETENVPDMVLCVLCRGGKIGSAYLHITTQQLYILSDMYDPQFLNTRNLFREVNFKHIITMGTTCDPFVKFTLDYLAGIDDTTVDSDWTQHLPSNLTLLPSSEYSPAICQQKILNLHLPSIPTDCSVSERDVYFHSLLNFDNKLSVHALGALINFSEMHWVYLNSNDENEVSRLNFVHINQVSMENCVYIDKNTFQALQIFHQRSHGARFKHGSRASNKEGQSIFRLFSSNCSSVLGYRSLRNILLKPINDINQLKKRLNFIDFAADISNVSFVQGMQSSIKKIYDVEEILSKIHHSQGKYQDWKTLYKTIYNILFFYEQTLPYRNSVFLLSDLDSAVTANLYALENCIRDSIDFNSDLIQYNRPLIKFGVDEKLDAKKLKRGDIITHLMATANHMMNQLPDNLNECTIVYVPEMGYLVATKKTDLLNEPDQLNYLGFQFMFELNETFHYKSAICKEMDQHLGQLQEDIISHELRIIERISRLVLKYNKDIREPLKIIAFIDCLISMSIVAKEKNFVRPTLNTDNIIEIQGGRHILLELQSDNIVPNDFKSGGANSRVKILTGPNSCGKSIYLKQIALLIYLAHIGSYIPAEVANISMTDTIHSAIHQHESAALRLTAFTIELSQMAHILHNAKPTSLIIIDEFGRGTMGQDALSLLTAALKQLMSNPNSCPHILIATHLHQIYEHLPQTSLLHYYTFDYTREEGNLILLFKILEGLSRSHAFDVAQAVGLDEEIVNRAREIYEALCDGTVLRPLHEDSEPRTAEYYVNVDIPPLDE